MCVRGYKAMKSWLVAFAVIELAGAPGRAQDSGDRKAAPPQSVAKLSAELRTEAAKLAAVSRSKLFADLGDVEVAKKLALSAEQRDQAGRLDELTRDVIRAWLLRDLDAMPPPPVAVLAARLSDRGERFRARLGAHAESIALEGILSLDQARLWRKLAGRWEQPLLPRRFAHVPATKMPTEDVPYADLVAELRGAVSSESGPGPLFGMLLGDQHGTPAMLSKEQQTVVRRLEELRAAIMRAWLTRGLDEKALPSWSVLFQRVTWSNPIRASVCTHAEAIALEGILNPEQADRVLGKMWKSARLDALLDPQLASRLSLTKAQQERVRILLYNKDALGMDHYEELRRAAPLPRTTPDGAAQRQQLVRSGRSRVDELDAMVWDVLTTVQARELARILGREKELDRRPAENRNKSTRSR